MYFKNARPSHRNHNCPGRTGRSTDRFNRIADDKLPSPQIPSLDVIISLGPNPLSPPSLNHYGGAIVGG
jgi:hypothetical protein